AWTISTIGINPTVYRFSTVRPQFGQAAGLVTWSVVVVGAISTSTSSLGSLLRCRVLMAAAMPPVLMIVSWTSMPVAASHLGMRVLRAMLALLPAMTSTGASEPVWDTPVVGSRVDFLRLLRLGGKAKSDEHHA